MPKIMMKISIIAEIDHLDKFLLSKVRKKGIVRMLL